MAIVTLTTDFGYKDYYAAAVKGTLYSLFPEIKIEDISHGISKYNILEAAFVLKNAYRHFPKGSIHIIGVMTHTRDAIKETEKNLEAVDHVALEYDGHYFIGADNGIFSYLLDFAPDKVFTLSVQKDTAKESFPTKDVFAKAAAHLARGGTLEVLGSSRDSLNQGDIIQARSEGENIRGEVIYVDAFGNAITNITESYFNQMSSGRDFTISTKLRGYNIRRLSDNYHSTKEGERLALFNSSGYLEIAMNLGHSSNLMGLKVNDVVRVEFSLQ
ncbi:MAG: S-adenosylmethionine hydrolase [Salibacteraceae bacterium]|jgi:S-adenosylmethionine hydrolase|tara:strand:+ start:1312 stop:2127 length:816 start_codon:yes stop_codon:yes gene_type:complete